MLTSSQQNIQDLAESDRLLCAKVPPCRKGIGRSPDQSTGMAMCCHAIQDDVHGSFCDASVCPAKKMGVRNDPHRHAVAAGLEILPRVVLLRVLPGWMAENPGLRGLPRGIPAAAFIERPEGELGLGQGRPPSRTRDDPGSGDRQHGLCVVAVLAGTNDLLIGAEPSTAQTHPFIEVC